MLFKKLPPKVVTLNNCFPLLMDSEGQEFRQVHGRDGLFLFCGGWGLTRENLEPENDLMAQDSNPLKADTGRAGLG